MIKKLEKIILEFIRSQGLIAVGERVLLAVSGGADSTALLYVLTELQRQGLLDCEFVCAHINHQLRGQDSDADEEFVARQSENLNVPAISEHIDVHGFADERKLSIETAARQLRIESLIRIAEQNNCGKIVTAHHKDDNAETLVHRLLRGTGFRGLAGINPWYVLGTAIFIRPMLCVTRKEILEYLMEGNLSYRTDQTNFDCHYKRNFIRHKLLPQLEKECGCPLSHQLYRLSTAARLLYQRIDSELKPFQAELKIDSEGRLSLETENLARLSTLVSVELVRRCLTEVGCPERNLSSLHYQQILKLAEEEISGRKVALPSNFSVCRSYGRLIFCPPALPKSKPISSVQIHVPGKTCFDKFLIETEMLDAGSIDLEKFKAGKTKFEEIFDADKISGTLQVRFRQIGDRFVPLGLKSSKKVGKFLTAEKVFDQIRDKVLIVEDAEKIIWLWPIRASDITKVTTKDCKILRLRITDTSCPMPLF